MLGTLFHTQTSLNRSIGFPRSFEQLDELRTRDDSSSVRNAIVAELGEAMQAAKPAWAWWRKEGDDLTLNKQRVADELVDVVFFLLTYVDQMQNSAYEEARLTNRLPLPLVPTAEDERIDLAAATLDMMELGLYDEDGNNAPMQFVQQLREEDVPDSEIITVMIRAALNAITDAQFTGESVNIATGRVLTVWFALGMDLDDLWRQYHAKARVNLERWHDAGILKVDDETYQTLLASIDEQGAQPRPLPTRDGELERRVMQEVGHARQMMEAMQNAGQVSRNDDGSPLLN